MKATPNLKRVKVAQEQGLKLTPTLVSYFMSNPEPFYPTDIAEMIADQLTTPGRVRTGSLAASSLPLHCYRAGVFQWIGADQNASRDELRDAILNNLFLDGHWRHLRLQATLLVTDLIDTIEHPLHHKELNIRGTADGISFEHGYGVEIKGAHDFSFQMLGNMKKPLDSHYWQTQAYLMLTGFDRWYVLYENKNTSDFKEFVVEPDQFMFDEIRQYARTVNTVLEHSRELPPMLPGCTQHDDTFKRCQYSTLCGGLSGSWPSDRQVSVSRSQLPMPKKKRGTVTKLPSVSVSSPSGAEGFQ